MSTASFVLASLAAVAGAQQVGDKCSSWSVIPNFGSETSGLTTFVANTVQFKSRADWGARLWNDDHNSGCNCVNKLTEIIPQADVTKVTIHHTAFTDPDDVQIKRIQDGHMNSAANGGNGWCDIGYQLVIGTDGTVYQGRPFWNDLEDDAGAFWPTPNISDVFLGPKSLNGKPVLGGSWPFPGFVMGAHVAPNYGNIGISLMGCYDAEVCGTDGSDPYSGPFDEFGLQYDALIAVLAHFKQNFQTTLTDLETGELNLFSHYDLKNTTVCPGEIRQLIDDGTIAADVEELEQAAANAPDSTHRCMYIGCNRAWLSSNKLAKKDRKCTEKAGPLCDQKRHCGPNVYNFAA